MKTLQTLVTKGGEITDHKQVAWYDFGNMNMFP